MGRHKKNKIAETSQTTVIAEEVTGVVKKAIKKLAFPLKETVKEEQVISEQEVIETPIQEPVIEEVKNNVSCNIDIDSDIKVDISESVVEEVKKEEPEIIPNQEVKVPEVKEPVSVSSAELLSQKILELKQDPKYKFLGKNILIRIAERAINRK